MHISRGLDSDTVLQRVRPAGDNDTKSFFAVDGDALRQRYFPVSGGKFILRGSHLILPPLQGIGVDMFAERLVQYGKFFSHDRACNFMRMQGRTVKKCKFIQGCWLKECEATRFFGKIPKRFDSGAYELP